MIRVRELVKRHGSLEVLRGLSLDVERGTVAAVIGPSGGGKSTFLRCLNGLEAYSSGTVLIGDTQIPAAVDAKRNAALLQQVRRKVGFVFQQFHLFPHFTVLENVIEAPIQVAKIPRAQAVQEAEELLRRVGLSDKLSAYPRHLSGGQQQRVAIARALAMKPEVLLFDEPTSALDPVMAEEVLGVMTELAQGGQTMIVVTHSMRFARSAATRVHVFAEGRNVEEGPPEVIFNDPVQEITKSFFRSAK